MQHIKPIQPASWGRKHTSHAFQKFAIQGHCFPFLGNNLPNLPFGLNRNLTRRVTVTYVPTGCSSNALSFPTCKVLFAVCFHPWIWASGATFKQHSYLLREEGIFCPWKTIKLCNWQLVPWAHTRDSIRSASFARPHSWPRVHPPFSGRVGSVSANLLSTKVRLRN